MRTTRGAIREEGFVLATVLVFLVVLSLTAFFAARLTRTDVQVVNTIQNEKMALYAAEAGVNEALYRLGIKGGSNVTITPGPGTFDASLYTRYRATATPCSSGALLAGSSPYGLDVCDPSSTVQVLFNSSAPAGTSAITVPTLQPVTYPVKYSTAASGATTNLNLAWDLCTASDAAAGKYSCSAAGQIRARAQSGCSDARKIVKVTSTGQVRRSDGSAVASRTVTVRAVDTGSTTPGSPRRSIITSNYGCPGLAFNGGASLTTAGSVQVNAGANNTCGGTSAVTGGNNNTITTCTDSTQTNCSFDVSGSSVASNPTYSPQPLANQPPVVDPYNDPTSSPPSVVNPPSIASLAAAAQVSPSGCSGTASAPSLCKINTATTLSPGIYWGGLQINKDVTLSRGLYVMAGGGFAVNSANVVTDFSGTIGNETGGGVTIYNTYDPYSPSGAGQYGEFTLGGGSSNVQLVASVNDPTTGGPWNLTGTNMKGFLVYQDRASSTGVLPNPSSPVTASCSNPYTGCIDLQGGSTGQYTLDGIVYAWNGPATLQGHANSTMNITVVVGSVSISGNSNLTIGSPSTSPGVQNCGGTAYNVVAWQDF